MHCPARTTKARALDNPALALRWGTSFSLCYPARQETKPLNLLWAHLKDLTMPASSMGNTNHSPAPTKTRLKHLLICTEGKSLSPGLSQQLQMPVCFIWGQPAEPHYGHENHSFHKRWTGAPEQFICPRFLDGKLDQPTKVRLSQSESEREKGRRSTRMREVGKTASSHQNATACPKPSNQALTLHINRKK